MLNLTSIIIFLCGGIIGLILGYVFFSKKKVAVTDNISDLSDVKSLVQSLANQISVKEGKDDERYEVINKITTAFTGGTKKQGAVGEILLINILQQAGFREGKDFEAQKKFDEEVDGEFKRKYPDIILHLPDNRNLIIDSKLSLNAWREYCEATASSFRGRCSAPG